MTTTEITTQSARYEQKLNSLEHQAAQARQEIEYLDKEQERTRILIELDEATPADLEDLHPQKRAATERLNEAASQLSLARKAHTELQERLEASQIKDDKAWHISNLEAYRDAARSIIEQLDSIGHSYEELRVLARQLHPEARLFQAISSAETRATKDWPKYLQNDIRRVNATLERLQAEGAVGA